MQERLAVTLPITGGILRPWTVDDAAWYVAARDAEIFRWTTERRDLTVAETEAAILRVNASDDVISWAIADAHGTTLFGNIALVYDQATRCAEVSYFLAAAGRGRGMATAAVQAVCAWAFSALDIQRILLQTRPGNIRSQAVAQRAGFSHMNDDAPRDSREADAQWIGFELANPRATTTT